MKWTEFFTMTNDEALGNISEARMTIALSQSSCPKQWAIRLLIMALIAEANFNVLFRYREMKKKYYVFRW